MPVAQRADVVGRWCGTSPSTAERFGGAFLQQHVGDEVEPRAGVVRFAVDGVAQQGFGRLQLSGDAQEAVARAWRRRRDDPAERAAPSASRSWPPRWRPADSR